MRRLALPWPILVLAAAVIAAVHSTPAQDAGPPPGLIVDGEAVPLDEYGEPILDDVPGVREAEPLDAATQQRLLELSEQRADIGFAAAAGAARAAVTPLAGEADAPARLDATDRDPDRLRSLPALPRR